MQRTKERERERQSDLFVLQFHLQQQLVLVQLLSLPLVVQYLSFLGQLATENMYLLYCMKYIYMQQPSIILFLFVLETFHLRGKLRKSQPHQTGYTILLDLNTLQRGDRYMQIIILQMQIWQLVNNEYNILVIMQHLPSSPSQSIDL